MSEHRDDKADLGSEREAPEKFLDVRRERLIRKFEGIDDERARRVAFYREQIAESSAIAAGL